ncbi:FtsX-like permease family protein [Dyadobacter flavalbus]|uniref:FtsX-like permease family protein n=1 Tax=Dyadobacter flavalbus TaxID=2579942 RepID=A0A5M8QRZ4_9BACT|nr:ABC transporter permease [Dyadobacter flavalbus]KAA6438849.1 FtsX-like permease family protein [Dyadobacter flavalbus]
MFRSFFITAIRNLKRNRLYTFINLLGLAVGVACCLVIFAIVQFETSFDDYHSKVDRIYRVNLYQKTSAGERFDGCNYTPLAEAVRNEVSGLEQVTGVYCLKAYQFSKENNLFEDKYAFFADQYYFDVFDAVWIAGNKAQALTRPNTVVVTDKFAQKFLGGLNGALGKTFVLENRLNLTVSGIVKAPASNTDHPYSMLISYPSLGQFMPGQVNNWEAVSAAATYVVFGPKTQKGQIDHQLKQIARKYLDNDLAKSTTFFLLALTDNHDRNYDYTSFTYDFPMPLLVILSVMAGMIALIACINFVNLATAQSLKRAREVGVRKTMGSSRLHLIMQYMTEAFIITLLAVASGAVLAQESLTYLNQLYGVDYQFDWIKDPAALLFVAGITVVVTFLAGFYPAFVLSAYKPVVALQSQTFTGKSKGLHIRRALVITQFAGAQLLIIVTAIMINQVNQFKDRPVSFDPKTIVVIPALRGNEKQQHEKLGFELQKVKGLLSYSFGNMGNQTGEIRTEKQNSYTSILSYADTSYIHTFQMKLLAGRNLSSVSAGPGSQVLVNQTLVKTLGFKDPASVIGKTYVLNGKTVEIRGVIRDSYTQSLSSKVDPVSIVYDPSKFAGVAIKISDQHAAETLAGIEKAWKNVYPQYLFKYQYMQDILNREYGSYHMMFSILGTASFLAIFIGCLGLYGLVSFMAIQRTKEIGVRKVFGATISNIMMMFTKESALLIGISFAIAAPLAHFASIGLLMEFPERVEPGIGIFIIGFMASLFIAVCTVAYRSFIAAIQNPGKSLRSGD